MVMLPGGKKPAGGAGPVPSFRAMAAANVAAAPAGPVAGLSASPAGKAGPIQFGGVMNNVRPPAAQWSLTV